MQPVVEFLFENEHYDLPFIQNSCLDEESLNFLKDRNYFRYDSEGRGQFRFVGLIHYRNRTVFVLPKYLRHAEQLSNDAKGEEAVRVCKVLRKFSGTYRLLPDFYNVTLAEDSYSEIVLADFLIRDYIENGIYFNEKREYELNSGTEADWPRTIETYDPFFSRGRPIYGNILSQVHIDDRNNVISELHKWAIKRSMRYYGKWLGFRFTPHFDSVESAEELGSSSYLLKLLKQELQVAYTDKKIRLLKVLIALIEKNYLTRNARVAIYGTGYYNVVWEKVCSHSFNNRLDSWSHYIPNPQWFNMNGEHFASDSLKPDVIAEGGTDIKSLFILDAKYYDLSYKLSPELLVRNAPGVADVTKQFLYEACFHEVRRKKYNCFLFPRVQSAAIEVAGYVTFRLFPGKKIWNLYLSPRHVFDAFLSDIKFGEQNLTYISQLIDRLDQPTP